MRYDDLTALVEERGDHHAGRAAHRLVGETLGAMADALPGDALAVIDDALVDADIPRSEERTSATLEDFFADLASRLEIDERDAAFGARLVAESIAVALEPDELERLRDSLSDDFLALFESQRGELTGEDVAVDQHGDPQPE